MKMRKIAAMGLSAVMAASMVPALPVMADDAAGKVYYLNFKPEQDEAWQNLAAKLYRRDRRTGNSCYSSFRTV